MRRFEVWGSLALLAAAMSACHGTPEPASDGAPALTVELVSPSRTTWPDLLAASGEVMAWQEASIGAEIGGVRLDEVLVNVGDVVRKDQLLARFNEEALRVELAGLEATVLEAAANSARAAADAKRATRLEAAKALSQQAILNYRTQAQAAEAQLASAKAQRDAQRLRLRHARVVAPDDGVISSRSATVGSVGAVGTELFRLVRQNRLEWRAQVRADALSRLKPGTPAIIRRLDGSEVQGRLRQLSPIVNQGTRNGLAYVDVPAGSGLAAGMYLSGHFALGDREAVSLPESALVMRDGNQYLMKVDPQHRVHEVKVATGRRSKEAIEILSDLAADDRFALSGGAFLNDGDVVKVVPAP